MLGSSVFLVFLWTILRVALLFLCGTHPTGEIISCLGRGFVNDLPVLVVLISIAALWLTVSGGKSLERRWWRLSFGTVLASGFVFGAVMEWFFFEEFNARYNNIAVDYLLFPSEVAGGIWESYNVPLWLGFSAVLGFLATWGVSGFMGKRVF